MAKSKVSFDDRRWWTIEKGGVSAVVFAAVRKMEEAQSEVFERFSRLEVLYDPNTPITHDSESDVAYVTENMIASNVDSISAAISTTDVRARVQTDGADWATQRRAKDLEHYAEEQKVKLGVMARCRSAFKESSKKGNGLTKTEVRFGKPHVGHTLIDNIVVDPNECRDGRTPRQMHEWVSCDVDELIARFPKYELEIENARTAGLRTGWRSSSKYPLYGGGNDVTYLESYRLPVGEEGTPNYRVGRHTICINGCDLLDEKWEDELFPYGNLVWTERTTSYYGIGGAERIAGLQRALNKSNWTIERQHEFLAMPTTYVRPIDAILTTKSARAGGITVVRGEYPKTITPMAVSPETYQRHDQLHTAGSQEFGQSSMATHAAKPAGLDSGVALREYRDQSSQRFALQEQAFEQLVLDTIRLVLWICKKLGKKAPTLMRSSRFGTQRITWADVDLGDMKVQLAVASELNNAAAGREQMVLEWAQAGVISKDSAARLIGHPDLEAELSLYTAALESVEHALDQIAKGKIVMPEPFMNLSMCRWRGQQEYLKWQVIPQVPEGIMESLRQFVVTAAWQESQQNQPTQAANTNVMPGSAAGAPDTGMGAPAMPPGLQGGPPMGGPAQAAFSPQAMQLVAGTG